MCPYFWVLVFFYCFANDHSMEKLSAEEKYFFVIVELQQPHVL